MSSPGRPDQGQPIVLDKDRMVVSREWYRFFAQMADYAIAKLGQLPGTNTNDDAQAGNIGELLSSTVASGTPVTLASGVTSNITSVVLSAGDWDVWGVVDYTFGAGTSFTQIQQGISTSTGAMGARDTFSLHAVASQVPNPAVDPAWCTPQVRARLSVSTTVYLVSNAAFGVSTLKAYGSIFARRRR